MRLIFTILTTVLVACNVPDDTKRSDLNTDSSQQLANTASMDSVTSKKEKLIDSTIYHSYIPGELMTWLNKNLVGSDIPSPSRWDNYWFIQYKKDSSLVNYVSGDFNCDRKKDHALILTENGTIAVYAFLAGETGFKKERLETYGSDNGELIDIGLELLKPGKYEHLDGDNQPPPANIKCAAIQLVYFEKAAVTYYWEKGKFKSIQTGD
jgi:hypothetical protein